MPHLLKRLELNGFKSFAQKTVIELPTGITAIVGPNGSGKSNIIDAVRWLLGEREARNLRSAKSEDLIFAGTPKKPRLGQAQAVLHFENENNFFPLEFSEISVSRQVNRDGTNKFFLNKAEIRLKNLIDFFAKARLGTKGLVVVTQGNSDVFVRVSPPERREMLEEMLGLREYQLKKISSERQLKNTQINFEKVDALLKEILPHLRSLKRQTGRWEKREILEKELRELENQFFGNQWQVLQKIISEIEKEIESHAGELKILNEEKKAAEENLQKIEASQPHERKELEGIKKELNSLFEKRSRLQKELGRLEAELELGRIGEKEDKEFVISAAKPLGFLEKIKDRLEKTADGEIDSLRSAVRETIEEIRNFVSSVVPFTADKETNKSSSAVETRLKELNVQLQEFAKNISDLQTKEEELAKHRDEFYGLFKNAAARINVVKEKIEKWENRNQERLFEKERLRLRVAELERQIEQANRSIEEFRNLPTIAAGDVPAESLEKRIFKLRGDLAAIGEIDEVILKESRETEERFHFLKQQFEDLGKAKNDLEVLIEELKKKIKDEFREALGEINEEFNKFFRLMFDGGNARLKIGRQETRLRQPALRRRLRQGEGFGGQARGKRQENKNGEEVVREVTQDKVNSNEEEKEIEEGIEISLSLPRKRISSLETLSGGEKSLVGIAALFALISVSPPPFLVLDEIDAALDSRNSQRFGKILKEFSQKTQFIIVTHNREVMEVADVLYGVTLNDDGTSKIVSLKLEK